MTARRAAARADRPPGAVALSRMPAAKRSAPDGMSGEWPLSLSDHRQALLDQEAEWRALLYKAEVRAAELEQRLARWSGLKPSDLAHEFLRGRITGKHEALEESERLASSVEDAARSAAAGAADAAAAKAVELFRDALERDRAGEAADRWADEVLGEDGRKRLAPLHRLLDYEAARKAHPSMPRAPKSMQRAASASLQMSEGGKVRDERGRVTGVVLHDGTLVEAGEDA